MKIITPSQPFDLAGTKTVDDLLDKNGPLKKMFKGVLEQMLKAELGHLHPTMLLDTILEIAVTVQARKNFVLVMEKLKYRYLGIELVVSNLKLFANTKQPATR